MTELETLDRLLEIEDGLCSLAMQRDSASNESDREYLEGAWHRLEDERQSITARFEQRISMAFELHRHNRRVQSQQTALKKWAEESRRESQSS